MTHPDPAATARCSFVPPHLLRHLAEAGDPDLVALAERVLQRDASLRRQRATAGPGTPTPAAATGAAWQVHDAEGGEALPGRLVRTAGQPASGDVAVDEAGTGLDATLALLADWGRSSYDDAGATAVTTVHYGQDYANAFWDGTQLVFGDGDGVLFGRFTEPVDVLGHELAHAVTQYAAGLVYEGQSGALNESVSDVVGACVKQRLLGQQAAEGDWLIGEGIFVDGVQGRALRSMSAPGTAYDDPRLGTDPQPGHMDDFVETADDNGGVHINSGIPNKAFHLAATAIGGTAWEGAGRIWYAALTSGLAPRTDFATFAAATVTAAGDHADAVRTAWEQVGLRPGAAPRPAPTGPAASGTRTVAVTRSGGFAGLVRRGEVDLDADDDRAGEVRSLLERIDFSGLQQRAASERSSATEAPGAPGAPVGADRYVYEFDCPGDVHVRAGEPDLDDDERRLAHLVLDL